MQYSIATFILILISIVYLKLARRYNIIDKPNERSSHTTPTVRGGGILFFVAMLLFFIGSGFQFPYFIIGLSLIAVISFVDDLITLGFKIRLLLQGIAVALLLYELQLTAVPVWVLLVTGICSVGFLNIFNFMDGINGITGLYSLSVLTGFFVINYGTHLVPLTYIVYAILAVLVFGFYNFRTKALFFAGDVGSISMAMILLLLVLKFVFTLNSPIILLLIGIYLVDGGATILRRLLKKENIFKPHRSHLYQLLVQKTKWTHLQVSGSYALLQFLLLIPVYLLYTEGIKTQLIGLALTFIVLGVGYTIALNRVLPKELPLR